VSSGKCASDAVDTFSRTSSNNVGATQPITAYRWFEVGEDANDDLITLVNSSLSFNYAVGVNPTLSANIGGFNAPDVDVSLQVKPGLSVFQYGIGYRLPAQDSICGAPGGYYALFDSIMPNTVALYYGSQKLAYTRLPMSSGTETLRVTAQGSSHKVYVNGILRLNVTDSQKTDSGYLGIATNKSAVTCNLFTVNPIDSDGVDSYQVSDSFARGNSNVIGEMTLSSYPWVKVNDTSGSAISISASSLSFAQNTGKTLNLACNIRGIYAQNEDVGATFYVASTANGASYGIGYRMPSLSGTYQTSGGYYATLKCSTQDTLTLYKGSTALASANITIPRLSYVPLRILASGSTHKVFFNGALTLTVTDTAVSQGYVGLFAAQSSMKVRAFSAGSNFMLPVPFGTDFALGGYGLTDYPDFSDYSYMEMTAERKFGWNMANGQDFWQPTQDSLNNQAATDSHTMIATMNCSLTDIPSSGGPKYTPDSYIQQQIQYSVQSVNSDFVGWYAYPEELDWETPAQFQTLKDCRTLCNEYGCGLPTYMYMAGNDWPAYQAVIVPYIDVVPSSVYPTYQGEPYAWVRFRNEETLSAISSAGCTVGRNYAAGQKTPVAVCELYWGSALLDDGTTQKLDTPQSAYHDFYQSIVSGAQGILVWDLGYVTINPENSPDQSQLRRVWDSYCKAASEISGPQQLGTVVLNGTTCTYPVQVVSGPATTCDFAYFTANGWVWYGDTNPLYPSVEILAKAWQGNTYIIAVDSYDPTDPWDPNIARRNPANTGPTVVTISGVPNSGTATVLFEGRTVPIVNGVITDSFASQAGGSVHIYKISGTNVPQSSILQIIERRAHAHI
jgi:hypothetical protein